MKNYNKQQIFVCQVVEDVCVIVDVHVQVDMLKILNGRDFNMSATLYDYNKLFGIIGEEDIFAMGGCRCACVSCNSCTCSCSCRAPEFGEIEW
jgi:conserved domain protein